MEMRELLQKQAATYRELARQLVDPESSERLIARAVELEAEAKLNKKIADLSTRRYHSSYAIRG